LITAATTAASAVGERSVASRNAAWIARDAPALPRTLTLPGAGADRPARATDVRVRKPQRPTLGLTHPTRTPLLRGIRRRGHRRMTAAAPSPASGSPAARRRPNHLEPGGVPGPGLTGHLCDSRGSGFAKDPVHPGAADRAGDLGHPAPVGFRAISPSKSRLSWSGPPGSPVAEWDWRGRHVATGPQENALPVTWGNALRDGTTDTAGAHIQLIGTVRWFSACRCRPAD